jgi:hypothetical protein
MEVHGFEEENIVVLMDDGIHASPTKENMIEAYEQIVADSEDGDAVFLHFSGKSSYSYKIGTAENNHLSIILSHSVLFNTIASTRDSTFFSSLSLSLLMLT